MIRLNPPIPKIDTTVPHEFFAQGHRYHVEGEFVFATSDVIQLCGLSDVSLVAQDQLDYAGHRGSAVHLAVKALEEGRCVETAIREYQALHQMKPRGTKYASFFDDVVHRMVGYLRWRKDHEVKIAAPMETSRVYRHIGTEYLIGTTIDFPAFVDGELYIIDLKTAHRNSGAKAKQDRLKWALQTQSYKEAGEAEGGVFERHPVKRAVLHLHPECGKVGMKGHETGWEWHEFTQDDSFNWDACIRLAMIKIANGYKIERAQ